jgi:hypothetical protein
MISGLTDRMWQPNSAMLNRMWQQSFCDAQVHVATELLRCLNVGGNRATALLNRMWQLGFCNAQPHVATELLRFQPHVATELLQTDFFPVAAKKEYFKTFSRALQRMEWTCLHFFPPKNGPRGILSDFRSQSYDHGLQRRRSHKLQTSLA